MSRYLYLFFFCVIISTSCSRPGSGLFTKKTAHEKYADSLLRAGHGKTVIGKAWLSAAGTSLVKPYQLGLPYSEVGYFAADRPAAAGFEFEAKRGLKINVITVPGLFIDLHEAIPGSKPALLTAAARGDSILQYNIKKDGRYILRIQPGLLQSLPYNLQLYTSPSLSFPVHRSGNPKIISLWGAGRDNGTRSHEGVDIGAAFRTPALAAADGRIRSVTENRLGGKVIFMVPEDEDYSIYYAHLDSQLVQPGQRVKAGDVIGLVGNTGNAQYTSPHLHFGIYTNNGAIDPLLFIDNRNATPGPVKIPGNQLNAWFRSQADNIMYDGPSVKNRELQRFTANDSVLVMAATRDWLRVSGKGGQTGFIKQSKIKK